ncbi:MAG: hypothetical protein A3G49_04380 [Candidatus Sungbacteria bacterium RIFCSPLOWO2_12_FULL_41_11]|uniref:Uncharacterized protein n=1 Tax=Candidatus Sungbacteria bacterium RIFCSPLOWO2_12_FULL_41_11 TaxID=1802286 RepID=A0A1G2LN11_9BACT|nr:MAG: hypothetical protein UV01_C0001G0028 [Parcubacteria group bacterium GW2011_GWA2_42_14]OGZ97527.1 MAG: hypothetical protein A3D41_01430 [Candidatus Sungbacteria bacterium RIFCSPHIGHO2_02_FULL_41_12b]OHA12914.1 MAG: hypothetical protein A3G49_04380 [Candidatus Sungbacteria bacterium RIFCSPLOWO2_12_FULL_41_11]
MLEMARSREEKMEAIKTYILRERERCGVSWLGTEYLFELSCFGCGEFYNLVERQLLNTEEGFGGWRELEDEHILEGAFLYVTEGKRG